MTSQVKELQISMCPVLQERRLEFSIPDKCHREVSLSYVHVYFK